VSYLDVSPYRRHDERRERLSYVYGFHCQFTLCSLTVSQQAQFAALLRKLDQVISEIISRVHETSPGPESVAEAKMMLNSMDKFRLMHQAAYVFYVDILLTNSLNNWSMREAEHWNNVSTQLACMIEGKVKTLDERRGVTKMFGDLASSLGQ